MLILAVDPGRTSGVVVYDTFAVKVVESAQVKVEKMPAHLRFRVHSVDLVAVESFAVTARTITLSRQPEAMYVIGGTWFLATLADKPFKLQAPADAKIAFSDAVLREMGLWDAVTGRHARDALRHALLAARRFL